MMHLLPRRQVRAERALREAPASVALCLIAACGADSPSGPADAAEAAQLDGTTAMLDASSEDGAVPPAADADANSERDTGGDGEAGIESAIVAPSAGPASCGCAKGHLCVRWAPVHSKLPSGLECWPMVACTTPELLAGTRSVCGCFNPCDVRHPGGGTFCFDRNDGAQIIDAEDIHCVQGQP